MKTNVLKLTVGIYSVAIGVAGMFGPMSYGPEPLVYAIQSVLIIVGVMLLLPLPKHRKTLLVIAMVIYSLIMAIGLTIMFMVLMAGLLLVAIIAPPLALTIASLTLLSKEKNN